MLKGNYSQKRLRVFFSRTGNLLGVAEARLRGGSGRAAVRLRLVGVRALHSWHW